MKAPVFIKNEFDIKEIQSRIVLLFNSRQKSFEIDFNITNSAGHIQKHRTCEKSKEFWHMQVKDE